MKRQVHPIEGATRTSIFDQKLIAAAI